MERINKKLEKCVELLNKIMNLGCKDVYVEVSNLEALDNIIDLLETQVKFNELMEGKEKIKKELQSMVSIDEVIKIVNML